MDANKEAKLREIGYHIRPACASCTHASIQSGHTWGTCTLHEYEHVKHTGPKRKLSIHMLGHCRHFEFDQESLNGLANYGQFWGL